jgi:hypothetical protein
MLVAGNSEFECAIARFLNPVPSSSSLQLIAACLKAVIHWQKKKELPQAARRGPVDLIGECILTVICSSCSVPESQNHDVYGISSLTSV